MIAWYHRRAKKRSFQFDQTATTKDLGLYLHSFGIYTIQKKQLKF